MPTTQVSIVNLALLHTGHTQFVDSMVEDSEEVSVANVVYAQGLDDVLEDFSWGFAKQYVTLGLIEEDPNDDWAYSYRYPSNCVKVRRIVTGVGRQDPNPPPFVIGQDGTARLIYTDQEEAVVEITARIEDPALFPAQFAQAFSWWLAFLMCPGLSKDQARTNLCLNTYLGLISKAKASDGNESQSRPEPESEAIRARE